MLTYKDSKTIAAACDKKLLLLPCPAEGFYIDMIGKQRVEKACDRDEASAIAESASKFWCGYFDGREVSRVQRF